MQPKDITGNIPPGNIQEPKPGNQLRITNYELSLKDASNDTKTER